MLNYIAGCMKREGIMTTQYQFIKVTDIPKIQIEIASVHFYEPDVVVSF